MGLAVLTFFSAFLLTSSVGVLLFHGTAVKRRLSRMAPPPVDDALLKSIAPVHGSTMERLVRPFQNVLPRSSEDVSRLRKRLRAAGYREKSFINVFYAFQFLVPGALCILVTGTQIYLLNPLFVYGLACGLGFLLPDFWLGNRISARKRALRLGLPEALDLIVICVEAGLSMDKATMRASEELRVSQPAIADELNLVYLEQRAGRPRSEAWKHFAERTQVDSIRSLASILIQADKFGTGIGKTLRTYSETLRTTRRQDAEELAAKTPVKLLFPLAVFIFPSLFVVTLGPSIITMLEGFAKYLN